MSKKITRATKILKNNIFKITDKKIYTNIYIYIYIYIYINTKKIKNTKNTKKIENSSRNVCE